MLVPKVYERYSHLLTPQSILRVRGRISAKEDEMPKLLADSVLPVASETVPSPQEAPSSAPAVPAPAQNSSAPAQDSSAPAQDSPASAQESSASAQKSPAPAQKSPAPAQDSSAPAQEGGQTAPCTVYIRIPDHNSDFSAGLDRIISAYPGADSVVLFFPSMGGGSKKELAQKISFAKARGELAACFGADNVRSKTSPSG